MFKVKRIIYSTCAEKVDDGKFALLIKFASLYDFHP